jgi:hypothetical protein
MNTDKLQATKSEKKGYETPKLSVYGNVEEITQSALRLGSGDYVLTQLGLPDCLNVLGS